MPPSKGAAVRGYQEYLISFQDYLTFVRVYHSDVFGDHALCCGSGGERISRHNALRDALFDTAVAAGLGPTKEGRFLLPGNDRRPADILVPHWSGGQDAAMDVTVVMPLQQATLTGAATTPGFALDYAFGNKVRGAEEECRAQGIAFLPIVAESLGGWHNGAEREVKKLGAALARHTGQEEGEAISHLWGRHSAANRGVSELAATML